jgi:hypothetical protein
MNLRVPHDELHRAGYTLLRGVLSVEETESLANRLCAALQSDQSSVLRSRGQTYGSRDLITLFPEVCNIPRRPVLKEFIASILGPNAGLVRGLYFDKPPDRSWSLAWHKDWTIAVKANDKPTSHFCCPTRKAGIPHVEAPEPLLKTMLTLRLHLDPMTAENGPLSVIPGSHDLQTESPADAVEIHAEAGDIFAMRPLLTHASRFSQAGTNMHRRVIHLEFAPNAELPDGYEWHTFRRIA